MPKLQFISIEQLLEMQANNLQFKVIEVLGQDSFNQGHLPGAINLPVPKEMTSSELIKEAKAKGLKITDTIVVYCASYGCHASTRATTFFLKAGFNKTVDFKAGKQGWVNAGLELER